MKTNKVLSAMTAVAAAICLAGCASTPSQPSQSTAASDGVQYKKGKDIQKVWLAEGFDFSGFDTVYIAPTKYEAIERPNEAEIRAWAMEYLPAALAESIRKSNIFSAVLTREADVKPGEKTLKMENTIFQYEKGGGGARYWAGLFGGGQPVIKVRGIVSFEGKPLFRYEASRSGESGGARMAGVFLSDKDIQRQDIDDLAIDMADFMARTKKSSTQVPPK